MKGYKVFNPDWTCRKFQFEVGKTYEEDVTPSCCSRGFHFCTELKDCFSYYSFDPNNKVAEIEALGEIDAESDKNKHCTNKIKIVRQLSWEEVLKMVNMGKANTGLCNSGDYNSGNCNSGNSNSGDCNSGHYNSGNCNSGNCNSSDCNCGNWNVGNWNVGNRNSGNYNSGHYNSSNWNSGWYNSGSYNSGWYNSGNWNSGSYNSGDWNSGSHNSGHYNNGDWNKTNYSSGCFNTKEIKILMFNKSSNWTFRDWCYSEAKDILDTVPNNAPIWIQSENMTDEEKEQHPEYKTIGGYLKEIDNSKCVQAWWDSLPDYKKNIIKALPNFDAEIFKDCTGIVVED